MGWAPSPTAHPPSSVGATLAVARQAAPMSDKRPSNARPYGADTRPSVGGGALDAPPSSVPPVIANQCALPPLQGEVSPALVPVTEGSPPVLRRGDPCGRPPSPPSSVGAIHESPDVPRPCPTNGRAMLGPTVQTLVSSVGGGALDAPPSPDPLSLRSSAPCLPLRGPWVCPSAHTGAVGVPLTKEVCRGSPFSHLRIIASLQKARTSSTAPSSPRTCSE